MERKQMSSGCLRRKAKGGIGDNGMDEMTLVPLNYGKTFINMRNKFLDATLMIKAKEGVQVQELSDETTMILRAARRLQPDEINNFSVNQGKPSLAGI